MIDEDAKRLGLEMARQDFADNASDIKAIFRRAEEYRAYLRTGKETNSTLADKGAAYIQRVHGEPQTAADLPTA